MTSRSCWRTGTGGRQRLQPTSRMSLCIGEAASTYQAHPDLAHFAKEAIPASPSGLHPGVGWEQDER